MIIKESEFKYLNIEKNISKIKLEIDLTIYNLEKISFLIYSYYKQYNINKFILNYDFEIIKIPYSKISDLIMKNIFKIIKENNNIRISFKGFPRCVYERSILRPGMRFYFEKNINYLKKEIENFYLKEICQKCRYINECKIIDKKYIQLNSNNEFSPILDNMYLFELNNNKISNFKNKTIKNLAKPVLENFKEQDYYLRKRIVFVDSFPKNLEDSSNERFVYFIYNKIEDFNKNYNLITQNFQYPIIKNLKYYLKKANQFAISFGIMGDNKIRKTFYFTIEDLKEKELISIQKKINIIIENNKNPWGIGFDFKDEKLISTKVYYKKKNVQKEEIINFFKDIGLEDKQKSKQIIDNLNQNINHVLYDYKYLEDNKISKKIEIGMQNKEIDYKILSKILNLDLKYFIYKEFYTLTIQLYSNKIEKINLYYTLLN